MLSYVLKRWLLGWLLWLLLLLPKLASLRINCLARSFLVRNLPNLAELHARLRKSPLCRFRDLRRGCWRRTRRQGSCTRLLILGHICLRVPVVQRGTIN
uniref:Uncharacterized protein n=1 Tax=Arundo donax TaxID=35708 RepID=A0A0A9EVM8_ARUDO